MGVCGSGKSTLGQALAQNLKCRFVEGDDLHPAANVEKMRSGMGLNDTDRTPWLKLLAGEISEAAIVDQNLVLSCSALKRRYRDLLRAGDPTLVFIHLNGTQTLLAARLEARLQEEPQHFMPQSLLESQLRELEPLVDDEHGLCLTLQETASTDDLLTSVLALANP